MEYSSKNVILKNAKKNKTDCSSVTNRTVKCVIKCQFAKYINKNKNNDSKEYQILT